MKKLALLFTLLPTLLLAQSTKPTFIQVKWYNSVTGDTCYIYQDNLGNLHFKEENGSEATLSELLNGGTGEAFTVVADTTALKTMDTTVICQLRKLGPSGIGGGTFLSIDSTYAEGVVAFDHPTTGQQWVRTEYLEKPNTINALWAGTIARAITAASSGQTVFVPNGTYDEVLDIKNGVNLVGSSHVTLTYTGADVDSGVIGDRNSNDTVTIQNINVEQHLNRTGLYVMSDSSKITLVNCEISSDSGYVAINHGMVDGGTYFGGNYLTPYPHTGSPIGFYNSPTGRASNITATSMGYLGIHNYGTIRGFKATSYGHWGFKNSAGYAYDGRGISYGDLISAVYNDSLGYCEEVYAESYCRSGGFTNRGKAVSCGGTNYYDGRFGESFACGGFDNGTATAWEYNTNAIAINCWGIVAHPTSGIGGVATWGEGFTIWAGARGEGCWGQAQGLNDPFNVRGGTAINCSAFSDSTYGMLAVSSYDELGTHHNSLLINCSAYSRFREGLAIPNADSTGVDSIIVLGGSFGSFGELPTTTCNAIELTGETKNVVLRNVTTFTTKVGAYSVGLSSVDVVDTVYIEGLIGNRGIDPKIVMATKNYTNKDHLTITHINADTVKSGVYLTNFSLLNYDSILTWIDADNVVLAGGDTLYYTVDATGGRSWAVSPGVVRQFTNQYNSYSTLRLEDSTQMYPLVASGGTMYVQDFSMFLVAKTSDTSASTITGASADRFIELNYGGNKQVAVKTNTGKLVTSDIVSGSVGGLGLYEIDRVDSTIYIYLDGRLIGSGTADTTTFDVVRFGYSAATGRDFIGDVSSFVLFKRRVTAEERGSITKGLMTQYGVGTYVAGNLTVQGEISATNVIGDTLYGDGSHLTGITSGGGTPLDTTGLAALVDASSPLKIYPSNDGDTLYVGEDLVGAPGAGDIEGVTAGDGIQGGGTSGTVTITASPKAGGGLKVTADSLEVDSTLYATVAANNAKVASVTAGNTFITIGGTATNPTVASDTTKYATATASGFLKNLDWTAFDAKVDFSDTTSILSYIKYLVTLKLNISDTASFANQFALKADKATTMTVAATSPLASSVGAQDLSANRTWTITLPGTAVGTMAVKDSLSFLAGNGEWRRPVAGANITLTQNDTGYVIAAAAAGTDTAIAVTAPITRSTLGNVVTIGADTSKAGGKLATYSDILSRVPLADKTNVETGSGYAPTVMNGAGDTLYRGNYGGTIAFSQTTFKVDADTSKAGGKVATYSDIIGRQPLDADLTAIAAMSATGTVRRTGADTWTATASDTVGLGTSLNGKMDKATIRTLAESGMLDSVATNDTLYLGFTTTAKTIDTIYVHSIGTINLNISVQMVDSLNQTASPTSIMNSTAVTNAKKVLVPTSGTWSALKLLRVVFPSVTTEPKHFSIVITGHE